MSTSFEHITGIIDKIIFRSEENGYTVLVLKAKSEPITTCGTFANIQVGQQLHVKGHWKQHPKFGKQFIMEEYSAQVPTTSAGIEKYLSSGLIKGIGKVYAQKLVAHFGADILDIIDTDPEQLYKVPGIGKKRIDQITASWQEQKYIANIMVFLQEKGLSTTYATKIYKKYGNAAIALITENPYRIIYDIWGIGFKTADTIAQKLGFEHTSVKRVQAGIIHTIQEQSSIGHLYVELDHAKTLTFTLLELDPHLQAYEMKHALTHLYQEQKIKLLSHKEKHYITLPHLYGAEYGTAQKIKTLLEHAAQNFDLQKIYKQLQEMQDVGLHEQQEKSIVACFSHKINIITGGPGTGKTTTIKTLLNILDKHHMRYKLAAPTGRAAKRMMEGTGRHAMTIHRMLEFDGSTMQFTYNQQNALKTDFLIIDEASMIDIFLAHSIIKAIPRHAHIIFIGDIDQLPSVGPGAFLHDLIESKKVGFTKLTHIFRQAQDSMIVTNAHKINNGDFPTSKLEGCKKDYYFLREDDPTKAFSRIQKALTTIVGQHKIKKEDATILVPMHKGIVGAAKLNYELQQFLNAGKKPYIMFAGVYYKLHDQVMQLKNNYDKKVFNGDVGTITSVNTEDGIITITFDNKDVEYQTQELYEITLAYAVTIHKSQGSEYPAVIIPIFMQHFTLLQRNLIYTAITRAKKLCIFIGQPKALGMAITNTKTIKRTTFLDTFLQTDLQCV